MSAGDDFQRLSPEEEHDAQTHLLFSSMLLIRAEPLYAIFAESCRPLLGLRWSHALTLQHCINSSMAKHGYSNDNQVLPIGQLVWQCAKGCWTFSAQHNVS